MLIACHPNRSHPVRLPGSLANVALTALGALAAAVHPGAARAQSQPIVVVRATDYKFEAPALVPAGTIEFRLENAGNEVHHLWLVQLRDGRTYSDFLRAMDASTGPRMPKWAVDVGGPNDVSAGLSATAWLTLEPGKYVLVCYVPAPDGRPHVMHGMVKELTVARENATDPNEPAADVELKLADYGFDLSKPISAGTRIIRIENVATQSHEVVIGRLRPGKTMRQALDWLNGGQHGAGPVIAVGGASGLATGRHQTIKLSFEPGRYVFLCFIPDVKDGKPHTAHGMAKEITVGPASTTSQR
jgi:uncharacterized cupredoxin-like copper-binding protein